VSVTISRYPYFISGSNDSYEVFIGGYPGKPGVHKFLSWEEAKSLFKEVKDYVEG
jgi:hypothetical protein